MTSKEYREALRDPRWQRIRLEVFSRDGWSCTECGRSDLELHVHHTRYFPGPPWATPKKYLKTLCKPDHEAKKKAKNGICKKRR